MTKNTNKTVEKTPKTPLPRVAKDPMRPRNCKYCKTVFSPKRIQDHKAKFCQDNCRKEFFRSGRISPGKFMRRMAQQIEENLVAVIDEKIDARLSRSSKLRAVVWEVLDEEGIIKHAKFD